MTTRKISKSALEDALRRANSAIEENKILKGDYAIQSASENSDDFVIKRTNRTLVRIIRGPKGGDGEKGLQGGPGNKGNRGEKGIKGDQGVKGRSGERGFTGNRGERGEFGIGSQGERGEHGISGKDGVEGKQGKIGIRGYPGAYGKDGEIGAIGATGKAGVDGNDGEDGAKGDIGEIPKHEWESTKLRFQLPGADRFGHNIWGRWVELRGPEGIHGGRGVGIGIQGSSRALALKSNGVQVGDVDINVLDFSSDFTLTESPDREINIEIATAAGFLRADGSIPLIADWDAGAFKITANEFRLNDNEPITFGDSSDDKIYHDGTNLVLEPRVNVHVKAAALLVDDNEGIVLGTAGVGALLKFDGDDLTIVLSDQATSRLVIKATDDNSGNNYVLFRDTTNTSPVYPSFNNIHSFTVGATNNIVASPYFQYSTSTLLLRGTTGFKLVISEGLTGGAKNGILMLGDGVGGLGRIQDAGGAARFDITDGGTTILRDDGGAPRLTIDSSSPHHTFAGDIAAITMVGNITMGDNSVTGIDTLTFTDVDGTIRGIANKNLLDKTATEAVSGAYTFSADITMSSADIDLGANQLKQPNDWGVKWEFAGSGIVVAMVDASKSWEWAVSGAGGLLRWVWRKDGATRVEFPMTGDEAIQTAGDINIFTHRLVQDNAWGDKWHMAGPTVKVTMEDATDSWLSTWGESSGLRRFKWSVTRTGSIVGSLLELGESNTEGGAVFNQDAKDYDFRVEGENDEDLLHVDASTDHVGVSTATPLSVFEVLGSFGTNITAISSATTLDDTHHVVTCDASGAAFTVTLPAASGVTGRIYHIKKTDSSGNAVTVDGNSSETIDGEITQIINVQYDSMMIICDGSNWYII